MPTYAYRGIQCDHEFDIHQSFSDDALTECIVCGQPVRRVIQASPIVFKGSGWYKTDSRAQPASSNGGNDTKPDSKDDAAKPSTDDKPSTDAKTPAAAESKSKSVAAAAG